MTLHEEIHAQLAKMEGWCDPEKAIELAETVIREKPKVCVEIGVFGGKSLLAIAYGLRESKSGYVIGVDSWKASDCIIDVNEEERSWWGSKVNLQEIYEGFRNHLDASGLESFVKVWRTDSRDASLNVGEQVDLWHCDGCHSEWSSTSDVIYWLPKVRSGGIVVMDDSNWQSTQTAVRFVKKFCDPIKEIVGKQSTSTFFRKR